MKKRLQKKSEVLREGYVKGLKKAQQIINKMLNEGVYYVHDEDIHETGLRVKDALDELAPSAAKVVRVQGGYACFDTMDDYYTWKNQK